MPIGNGKKLGVDLRALAEGDRATRVETTTGGEVDRVGGLALQNNPFAPKPGVGNGDDGEQGFAIWMRGFVEDGASGADLDDPA